MTLSEIIDDTYRRHHGSLVAALMRDVRDLELAEDLLQDAVTVALAKWEANVPDNPAAWLLTTARRKAIDRFRHEKMAREKADTIRILQDENESLDDPDLVGGFKDERLRLVFTCCHPSLSTEAQVALTLRTICGMSTQEIAKSFLVPEATLAQRIVRAKKKIKLAGIPYQIPNTDVLPERINAVLAVIYLVFNEGYHRSHGDTVLGVDLCEEAIRLSEVLGELITGDAEVLGLQALMALHHARRHARTDEDGILLTLEQQDRTRWDRDVIAEAAVLVELALKTGPVGPYQIQAAIAALHATAPDSESTDWGQIVGLYDQLLRFYDSPIVALNRAAAVAMAHGADRGLELIDAIEASNDLQSYALMYAAKADLHRRLGSIDDALGYYERAIELTQNRSERLYYERRRDELTK